MMKTERGKMATWITVCDTCKRDDWPERDMAQTDGEALAELIEAAATGGDVRVRRHSCLMGCKKSCNVTIQAADKISYTLGGFVPGQDVAEAIVSYADNHRQSATGQVAYRLWPEALKGHFVTRHPPLPSD